MIMDAGLNHPAVLPVDVHGNSGDIDSLLSNDPSDPVGGAGPGGGTGSSGGGGPGGSAGGPGGVGNGQGPGGLGPSDVKARRLLEPYERHRAHDLRAECYRRGIRPIKKGPHANDNKNGYILLLRKYDGTATSAAVAMNGMVPGLGGGEDRGHGGGGGAMVHNGLSAMAHLHAAGPGGGGGPGGPGAGGTGGEDDDDGDGDSDGTHAGSLTKKRKLPSAHGGLTSAAAAVAAAASDLSGFYDATPPSLVPVLPMQYTPSMVKAPTPATTTTDLEILSGIANTYTTQGGASTGAHADNSVFCGSCRTIVTDQLMESIRLGRNKMQMLEQQRHVEQRDRDTGHLRDVMTTLRELRQTYREAQNEGRLTHELMVELEDDIAFFQTLKERTKERMRKEMQEARERAAKQANASCNTGTA